VKAEETRSAKNQKMKRDRRRTIQVASSGRRYFRLSVIVSKLSNKQLHLIQNLLISCRVTWMRDNIFKDN
jgi:hypothetical protein